LFNEYGPTEATVWSTVFNCHPDHPFDSVPIGRPIENTRVYILDRYLNPVPPGIPGELCIAGPGDAQGYVNQSELTARQFVVMACNHGSKERIYKTGDWACFLEDGNIKYLGRRDEHTKICGYRIEIKETETIPAHIVIIDRMPLTANGKVDREALPEPDRTDTGGGYVAPRTQLEEKLASIWAKQLKLDKVGIKDNFFELGGASLLALRLIADIKNGTGHDIPLAALFKNPTIEKLVKYPTNNYTPKKRA
jgi:non-ribosomal peptide synthetase component F